MAKYDEDLMALFAALEPKQKDRFYAAAKKAMKRDVTPDLLGVIVSAMTTHGRKRKWKAESCFKKAFLPPFTASAESVYEDVGKRMDIFDQLFESK